MTDTEKIWFQGKDRAYQWFYNQVCHQVKDQVWDHLWDQVGSRVENQFWDQTEEPNK